MTKRSGSLERAVVKSSVMPSLKYSCLGSSLMLAKGRTAIEGLSGMGRAGVCAEGMDADGAGGRNERCCTTTTVAVMIVSPTIEKTPRRRYFRANLRVFLGAVAPVSGSTRNTRTGSTIFLTV